MYSVHYVWSICAFLIITRLIILNKRDEAFAAEAPADSYFLSWFRMRTVTIGGTALKGGSSYLHGRLVANRAHTI